MDGTKRKELEHAITVLEAQRDILGNAVVNTAVAALQVQLASLNDQLPPAQQRKLVTVVFMDIVGSTQLLATLDPEENLAIMDAALQQLAKPITTHGGQVTRFMGDGYLAVFGLPFAQENDPEMAVRAGLEIQEKALGIASYLEKERNLPGFTVRLGINTGLVVAGGVTEAEATLTGAAVNLAARLETLAPPGGLLISQHTHQHVRGIFNLEPGEKVQVKGFAEPIQVYLVKNERPAEFQQLGRGIEGVEVPMIGREQELAALQDAFNGVIQRQEGQFVTIVGEAGLGKSRLLKEFEQWLESHPKKTPILKGRATLENINNPYRLLRDLAASQFGILDDDPIQVVRDKLIQAFQAAFGESPKLELNAQLVGHLLGYDFHDSPLLQRLLDAPRQLYERALEQLTNYFKSLAQVSPVIIFLDDIHWADESSLDTVLHLCRTLSEYQVLLITLTRPTLYERRPTWGNGSNHLRVNLHPLSLADCQDLVRKVLGKVDTIPETLSNIIVSNAEGNPYYLEELVKMLLDDKVIIRGTDRWQIDLERLTDMHVPATLTGVLQARLDHLPASERMTLQQASVVGRVFWDDIIRYINDTKSTDQDFDLLEVLTSLCNRELIFKRETSAFTHAAEHIFKHTILREVTYESVLRKSRQVYHALVADWLILNSGSRLRESAGLIAGHMESAGKPAKALEYMCMAADAALSNYAIEEAISLYDHALALTPSEKLDKRFTLLIGKETALSIQGNRAVQREVIQSIIETANAANDDRKRAEAQMREAWLFFWTSNYPEMYLSAQQALGFAQRVDANELIQNALYATAWSLLQQNDFAGARKSAEDALILAQQRSDLRGEGNILNILGLANIVQGNFSKARDQLEGFLSIAREIDDRDREVTALNNLGVVYNHLGNHLAAEQFFQQLMAIAKERNDQVSFSTSLVNLAWTAASQEKWEDAKELAEQGLEIKRRIEHTEAIAECLVWLGHSCLGLNQPKKAFQAYQEAYIIRSELEQKPLAMGALAGLARSQLALGDLYAAKGYVEEILTYLEEGGSLDGTWEPLRIYLTCVQILQQSADPRATKLLEDTHNHLQNLASLIPDQASRDLFLYAIPWHREILQLWEHQA